MFLAAALLGLSPTLLGNNTEYHTKANHSTQTPNPCVHRKWHTEVPALARTFFNHKPTNSASLSRKCHFKRAAQQQ